MSLSYQTLIDEFENVVFEKVEMEYQDYSTVVEFFPLLVNQDSKSDIKKIKLFRNEQSASSKMLSIDPLEKE